jgi:hypothetical protein
MPKADNPRKQLGRNTDMLLKSTLKLPFRQLPQFEKLLIL